MNEELMTDVDESRTIEISNDLMSRIDARIKYTEFSSSEEYISYVLESVLFEVEKNNTLLSSAQGKEKEVEDRLKSLGYLNE